MGKKLLIIGSSLNYGSPGHICEGIGLAAIKAGWTVYQAHGLKYSRPSALNTYLVSSKGEELWHTFESVVFDAHGLSSKGATHRLVKWINEINPDVINLHNLHGYYLNYKILFEFLSILNKPIVWTIHDFWPITGHCAHFDYIGCNKWQTMCCNCPQRAEYPLSLFFDFSNRNYIQKKESFTSLNNLTLVPVSKWVGKILEKSFLRKYLIYPIYNGIDRNIFKNRSSNFRNELSINDKFVLIGVASPWYELKGFNDYIALSKRLPHDCVIVMVGLNKKQIKELPNNIIGIERTENQEELAALYSMADATLNLSYQETFGMTTVEGMSCGTPGIVYDRTASPELVDDSTGRIVPAGNIVELVNAVSDIKIRGKQAFSKACEERVTKYFDKNYQFNKYVVLFNELAYH